MANPPSGKVPATRNWFKFYSEAEINDSLLLIETDEKERCSILILVYIS